MSARTIAPFAAISPSGTAVIHDDTVERIAMLLREQGLADGSKVVSYAYPDEDYPSYVPSFDPSLLPVMVQDQIRDRLAGDCNGRIAARLFDAILKEGASVQFCGTDDCEPHIKAVLH